MVISESYAADEGPLSPSSASGANWKAPGNVIQSDNLRTEYKNASRDILSATRFGFNSVCGIIDGIKVEIEGYGIGAQPPTDDQIDVALTKDGSTPSQNWKTAITLPNGSSNEAYITAGDSADLWGAAWNPSEIQDSLFGVLIRDADSNASYLYIDHVRVTVYFRPNYGARRIKLLRNLIGD